MPRDEETPQFSSVAFYTDTLAVFRIAKAQASARARFTMTNDTFLRALLLHWQANPPRRMPERDDLRNSFAIAAP